MSSPSVPVGATDGTAADDEDAANAGVRREPELPEHEAVEPERLPPTREFDFEEEGRDEEDAALKARVLRGRFGGVARQAALDPDDGVAL